MATLQHKAIVKMDWDTFADKLQPAARGVKRNAAEEKALREYFGDEEYEDLQRLATHARLVRSRALALGNVVFLPGIMGSDLATVDKDGDEDLIWVNLFRLAAGQIERLELAPDGTHEEDPAY